MCLIGCAKADSYVRFQLLPHNQILIIPSQAKPSNTDRKAESDLPEEIVLPDHLARKTGFVEWDALKFDGTR
jgi:hypothetical protein